MDQATTSEPIIVTAPRLPEAEGEAVVHDVGHQTVLEAISMRTVGLDESTELGDGRLVEFVELEGHPFFVGTQAHPEFKSRPTRPAPLFDALRGIGAQNAQGEYYLPDLIAIYRRQHRPVATWTVANAGEIRGINSRSELAEVSGMVRQQKNEELMASGVTLVDPATTYVDVDVVVGADTVIHPGVHLEGSTKVGAACEIHAGVRLVNATVGDRVTILNHCLVIDSVVGTGCQVGPDNVPRLDWLLCWRLLRWARVLPAALRLHCCRAPRCSPAPGASLRYRPLCGVCHRAALPVVHCCVNRRI